MIERLRQLFPNLIRTGALAALGLVAAAANAALIAPGTPTTTVPAALIDPLNSLTPPPSGNWFLLPIEVTGASGLQSWSFDLTFDGTVVTPLDVGGLYQSVYQAEFNGVDPTPSDITSSGFSLPGVLAGIAGFSSGVSGDGTLTYVLFEFLPDQENNNPNFGIENPTVTEAVPEASSLALLTGGLLALFGARRRSPHGPLRAG